MTSYTRRLTLTELTTNLTWIYLYNEEHSEEILEFAKPYEGNDYFSLEFEAGEFEVPIVRATEGTMYVIFEEIKPLLGKIKVATEV